jgi:hypothetical protein
MNSSQRPVRVAAAAGVHRMRAGSCSAAHGSADHHPGRDSQALGAQPERDCCSRRSRSPWSQLWPTRRSLCGYIRRPVRASSSSRPAVSWSVCCAGNCDPKAATRELTFTPFAQVAGHGTATHSGAECRGARSNDAWTRGPQYARATPIRRASCSAYDRPDTHAISGPEAHL